MEFITSLRNKISDLLSPVTAMSRGILVWGAERMWVIGTAMMVISTPMLLMGETEKAKVMNTTQPLASVINNNKAKQDELTNKLLASGAGTADNVSLDKLPM
jgi:hypothetical protein